jgi:hypothetical protein
MITERMQQLSGIKIDESNNNKLEWEEFRKGQESLSKIHSNFVKNLDKDIKTIKKKLADKWKKDMKSKLKWLIGKEVMFNSNPAKIIGFDVRDDIYGYDQLTSFVIISQNGKEYFQSYQEIKLL